MKKFEEQLESNLVQIEREVKTGLKGHKPTSRRRLEQHSLRKQLLQKGGALVNRVRSNNHSLELLDVTNTLSTHQDAPRMTEPNQEKDIEIKIFNINSNYNSGGVGKGEEGEGEWGVFLLNT